MFVDGERVTELGTKIFPNQQITLSRAAASEQTARVTILLNKPIGYVSGQPEPGYKPAVTLSCPTRTGPKTARRSASSGRT